MTRLREHNLSLIKAEKERRRAEREAVVLRRDAEEIRDDCQTLTGFIRHAWKVLEPAADYVHGWHIDAMAEHLEAVHHGEIDRLLMNVPPGTMKSLITGVFFPAWEWGPRGMPHLRVLGASYSEDYAVRDTGRMRDLVKSDWYQSLWGDQVRLIKTGERKFTNDRTGWRQGVPFERLTGGRAHRVIIDDPHSTTNADSAPKRERAVRTFRESVPTRLVDPRRSAIIVIMQRLHEGDVSGAILEMGLPYVHLMLPMEFEPDRRCVTAIGFRDPRTADGELLFPERFPREVVERDKIVLGSYAVAGQMQQSPSPREGALFMIDNVKILRSPPAPVVASVRYWDKAGTAGGGAFTAGVLMHRLMDGSYLIGHVVRGQWSAYKRESRIRKYAELDGPRVRQWIEQEPGSGGKESAERTIKNLAGFNVHADVVSGQGTKEMRAEPLSVQIEAGNVAMLHGNWNAALIDEMRLFPNSKYKDQCDAAAGAFSKVAAPMLDYDKMTRM